LSKFFFSENEDFFYVIVRIRIINANLIASGVQIDLTSLELEQIVLLTGRLGQEVLGLQDGLVLDEGLHFVSSVIVSNGKLVVNENRDGAIFAPQLVTPKKKGGGGKGRGSDY
jgi:hypothetical protein